MVRAIIRTMPIEIKRWEESYRQAGELAQPNANAEETEPDSLTSHAICGQEVRTA